MSVKLAVLALFLSCGTAFADTITVNLAKSNEIYRLLGTGGNNGYGTYLAQQGDCVAGTSRTLCTLSGAYTGTTAGYSSGTYSLITSYDNADGGLAAISSDLVTSCGGGNSFVFEPFASGVMMSMILNDFSGAKTVSIVTNGAVADVQLFLSGVAPKCDNLPGGVRCTQGNVGLNDGSSIFSQTTGTFLFDSPVALTPEPELLVLAGLLPGTFLMLRRRFARTH